MAILFGIVIFFIYLCSMEKIKCNISKIGNVDEPVVKDNIEIGRSINGFITIKPCEGGKCVVYYDAKLFATSQIKKITSENDNEVVFETLNSIYRLTYVD